MSEETLKQIKTRRVTENEIVPSDRTSLVNAAILFVGQMVGMKTAPLFSSASFPTDIEPSQQEVETYNAALRYLEQEFSCGHEMPKSFIKRVETEEVVE